tara:strand:- start:5115 stop:6671 length:1557 start_codon:yes stop_codon:yes gene_type:complete
MVYARRSIDREIMKKIVERIKNNNINSLSILKNINIKVGVVCATNKLFKIYNILNNFKQQNYFNKKLFLILNNNKINIKLFNNILKNENIVYQIIVIDEKFNLGYCLNKGITLMKEQKYDIFAKFDDDDIYQSNYLLEQVNHINNNKNDIVGKYNVPIFIPETNNFYTIENFTKNNQYAEICRGSTITFYINNINHLFDEDKNQGIDTIFLKQHLKNKNKIFVTSFHNYIWIRYLDSSKHTWNLNINNYELNKIIDSEIIYNLYSSLLNYTLIDVSHLLASVIITMYNSSKTIIKCLQSILNQTHKNIEIIVVDDSSTDNSIKIIENYMAKYNNIKLITNKENRGTYYSKNIALKSLSKNTKYIIFQDSDDYSHSERIRKQIEILYLTNAKLSTTLCKRYGELRFACISQVYDIEIFHKLGYFDNSRFGADSEYLYRFFKLYNIKMKGNYNYNNGTVAENNINVHYCIPHKMYIINNNDDTCLTNLNPLSSKKRIDYKNNYIERIDNLESLYYEFSDI